MVVQGKDIEAVSFDSFTYWMWQRLFLLSFRLPQVKEYETVISSWINGSSFLWVLSHIILLIEDPLIWVYLLPCAGLWMCVRAWQRERDKLMLEGSEGIGPKGSRDWLYLHSGPIHPSNCCLHQCTCAWVNSTSLSDRAWCRNWCTGSYPKTTAITGHL